MTWEYQSKSTRFCCEIVSVAIEHLFKHGQKPYCDGCVASCAVAKMHGLSLVALGGFNEWFIGLQLIIINMGIVIDRLEQFHNGPLLAYPLLLF